jgi:hypothetical protein
MVTRSDPLPVPKTAHDVSRIWRTIRQRRTRDDMPPGSHATSHMASAARKLETPVFYSPVSGYR